MLSLKNCLGFVLAMGFILSFLTNPPSKNTEKSGSISTETASSSTSTQKSFVSPHEAAMEEYKNKNYAKALDIWTRGAQAGDKDAQHYLAVWYLMGEKHLGIEVDTAKAVALLESASIQNQHEAQRLLASIYMDGQWTQKNVDKAIALYQKSAMSGNAGAMFDLGSLYLKGDQVAKNDKKLVDYYQKAATAGHSEAQMLLSTFYFKGEHGLTANNEKALSLLERSASQNNATAQFLLALYMNEQKQDKIASYQWIKVAMLNNPSSEAAIFIEKLKLSMTPEQIAEGEKRAMNWKALS